MNIVWGTGIAGEAIIGSVASAVQAGGETASRSPSIGAVILIVCFLVVAVTGLPVWAHITKRRFTRYAQESARTHLVQPGVAPNIDDADSDEALGELRRVSTAGPVDAYAQFMHDSAGKWLEMAPINADYWERWWRRRMDKHHYGLKPPPEGFLSGFEGVIGDVGGPT